MNRHLSKTFLDMAHEEKQPTLHQHSKDIASIARELLSHEPDNTFAKTIFSWFALTLNGQFFGHPGIDQSELVTRMPEHIRDDEDHSHLLDEIEHHDGDDNGDEAKHHTSQGTGEHEHGEHDDQNRYNEGYGDEHQYGHGNEGQYSHDDGNGGQYSHDDGNGGQYNDGYDDQDHHRGHGHGGW